MPRFLSKPSPQPRKAVALMPSWFCWICRKPMEVVHGTADDSTEYRVNGRWRDCHGHCHDKYSEGLIDMRGARPVVPDTFEALVSPGPQEGGGQ